MRSGRSIGVPKARPFDVAVFAPRPSIVTPMDWIDIPATRNELIIFAIGYHVFTGVKGWDIDTPFTVFVVPSVRWKVGRLAQVDRHGLRRIHRNHLVGGIVNTLDRVGRGHIGPSGRRMQLRPVMWSLDKVNGRLTEQHRTRFKVYAFVFKPHKECPHRVRLVNGHGPIPIVEAGVVLNGVGHRLVDLPAVFVHLCHARPNLKEPTKRKVRKRESMRQTVPRVH